MTPNDLIITVTGLFPRAFPTETSVTTWASTYRKTLGHLRPDQLQEAWDRTIAKWEKTTPPMPKHLLDNVPVQVRMSAASATKSFRAMSEVLPQLIGDLMREWWRSNAHWFDNECEARGLHEHHKRSARTWLNWKLQSVAHYQAQLQYWKEDTSPAMLDDATVNSIFSLALESKGPKTPFKPSMEGLKSAYVRDGKRVVEHDQHYSWMEEPEAS